MKASRVAVGSLSLAAILAIVFAVSAFSKSVPALKATPGSGHRSTTFVVRFRAPAPSGLSGGIRRTYDVRAAGPRRSGCLRTVSVSPFVTRAGVTETVKLNPRRLGGRWCVGKYSGTVLMSQSLNCPPREVCPAFAYQALTIGTFRFRVKR